MFSIYSLIRGVKERLFVFNHLFKQIYFFICWGMGGGCTVYGVRVRGLVVGGTGARGGTWSHGVGVVAPQKKAKKIRGNTDKNRGLPL